MLAGVTVNYFRGLSSGLTLQWVGEVLDLYLGTIWLSLGIALATLACTLLIGVPAAWHLVRHPSRLTRAIEEVLTLPVAVPGLAIALALILVYGGTPLRASWLFILVGHVLFTLPFMMRAVVASLQAIDARTLEDGAASLGAGPWRRFADVIVPNARAGILAGALMVVTLSHRGVQPHLDAAHAAHQDAAGGPRRQLRLDAARGRLGLHAGLLRDDRPASRRDPMGGPPARAARTAGPTADRGPCLRAHLPDGTAR